MLLHWGLTQNSLHATFENSSNSNLDRTEIQSIVQKEVKRLTSLTVNGKIKSNIKNATLTLPSSVRVFDNQCPFKDEAEFLFPGKKSYTRKYVNDIRGEITVTILVQFGNYSEKIDVTLTGFKTVDMFDKEQVEYVHKQLGTQTFKNLEYNQLRSMMTSNFKTVSLDWLKLWGVKNIKIKIKKKMQFEYKLTTANESLGQKAHFLFDIKITQGRWHITFTKNIYSADPVTNMTYLEAEKIKHALVDGKISTNIQGAENTLPSQVFISHTIPPFDLKNTTKGVEYSFSKVSHNDQNGTINIVIQITDGKNIERINATLTGFLTEITLLDKEVEKYRNHISYPLPSWISAKLLRDLKGGNWITGIEHQILGIPFEWIYPPDRNPEVLLEWGSLLKERHMREEHYLK